MHKKKKKSAGGRVPSRLTREVASHPRGPGISTEMRNLKRIQRNSFVDCIKAVRIRRELGGRDKAIGGPPFQVG